MAKKMTKAEMAEITGWGYLIASRIDFGGPSHAEERFAHWPGMDSVEQDGGTINLRLNNGQEFVIKISIPRKQQVVGFSDILPLPTDNEED